MVAIYLFMNLYENYSNIIWVESDEVHYIEN